MIEFLTFAVDVGRLVVVPMVSLAFVYAVTKWGTEILKMPSSIADTMRLIFLLLEGLLAASQAADFFVQRNFALPAVPSGLLLALAAILIVLLVVKKPIERELQSSNAVCKAAASVVFTAIELAVNIIVLAAAYSMFGIVDVARGQVEAICFTAVLMILSLKSFAHDGGTALFCQAMLVYSTFAKRGGQCKQI